MLCEWWDPHIVTGGKVPIMAVLSKAAYRLHGVPFRNAAFRRQETVCSKRGRVLNREVLSVQSGTVQGKSLICKLGCHLTADFRMTVVPMPMSQELVSASQRFPIWRFSLAHLGLV